MFKCFTLYHYTLYLEQRNPPENFSSSFLKCGACKWIKKKDFFSFLVFFTFYIIWDLLRWSRSRISICLFYSLNSLLSKALISPIPPPRQHNFTTFQQQYKQWRTSFPLLILFLCTVTADSCSWGKRAVMPEADFFFLHFSFSNDKLNQSQDVLLIFFSPPFASVPSATGDKRSSLNSSH